MPSGTKLTQEQIDAILRLVGELTDEDCWRHSYREIARRVAIDERTVRRVVRLSAAKLGRLTAWHDDASE